MATTPPAGRRAALGLLLLVACDDTTGPPTERIALDICDGSHWIAYQNDGAEWRQLGQGSGVYELAATRRLGIARARFATDGSVITIDYLTPEQAVHKLSCPPFGVSPGGHVGGSVAGLDNFHWATIIWNGIGAYVSTGGTSWQMEAQPVPATLVAVRYDSGTASVSANRIIVRREQSYLAGTLIPLLDFDSGEAFVPQVHTLSFTGPRAYASVWYHTRGREHFLSSVPLGPIMDGDLPRTAAFSSVPLAQQVPGDIHSLTLQADGRGAQLFFRGGSDRTLSLGPHLAMPTFTTVATAPYRRVRAELPSQAEYGAEVSVDVAQVTSNRSTRISLTATREYFGGTPAVWSLTVPDFSGVAGFQLVAAFAAGEFGWFARGSDRRSGLSVATAQDGETARSAYQAGIHP
jgi:hypothetical protein